MQGCARHYDARLAGPCQPTQGSGLELPDPVSADCITAEPHSSLDSPMVLTQEELDAIIANEAGYYANVHTATFPAGAIRGQLR